MNSNTDQLLEDIKKLTILLLVKGNTPATTDEIGSVLGVTGRAIRKIATKNPRKKSTRSNSK